MRSVDLYRIVVGSTVWRLTSAAKTQTHTTGPGGAVENYDPAAIGRGGVQTRSEMSKASVEVRLDLSHALATDLLSRWAEQPTTLTIYSKRTLATDVVWKGRLANIVPGDASVTLTFESIYTSMRRPGLRARFQKTCRHALYGRGCKVDPADFETPGTLASITGRTVVVAAAATKPDGYFSGGMIAAPDGTLSYVSEHVANALVLGRVSSALRIAFAATGVATAVKLYPGCDHSYATCRDKFDNDDNYGGFDYIPTKNPMGGSSIV